MNDRYLCKAKTIDSKKWIEGYYVKHEKRTKCPIGNDKLLDEEIEHFIMFDGFSDWNMPRELQCVRINPDTLCRCTGKKDKNNRLIWESDLLDGFEYPFMKNGAHNYFAEVCQCSDTSSFYLHIHKYPNSNVGGISDNVLDHDWVAENWEIIGNVFDNKELFPGEV